MLGVMFWNEIDGVDYKEEYIVCSGFEMDIQEQISLSRNGYLFSKDNALEQVFISRIWGLL